MSENNQNNFNKNDFFWIFQQLEKPAFYLSDDFFVVEVTKNIESLFLKTRSRILGKKIEDVFKESGLIISLPTKIGKNISINLSPENESISNENKTVFSSLFWQLRKIQKTLFFTPIIFLLLLNKGMRLVR